jgi:putative heme-binding domain-containing protein
VTSARYHTNFAQAALLLCAVMAHAAAGQVSGIKNPLEGDLQAVTDGAAIYRTRCASCHGNEARGAAGGCDLTRLWSGGATDQQVFQSVRRGLPNTIKPHSFGPERDVWAVLAFLRTKNADPAGTGILGNTENGRRVFESDCSGCHQVNGNGGRLGPDLSQVGSSRSPSWLAHKIRHASAYFMSVYAGGYVMEGYDPVTLVTRTGQRIRGAKKNEDAFSIQIMDTRERLQGYLKANLREVINEETSLMPDFVPDRLAEPALQDLVAYLTTLRAPGRP